MITSSRRKSLTGQRAQATVSARTSPHTAGVTSENSDHERALQVRARGWNLFSGGLGVPETSGAAETVPGGGRRSGWCGTPGGERCRGRNRRRSRRCSIGMQNHCSEPPGQRFDKPFSAKYPSFHPFRHPLRRPLAPGGQKHPRRSPSGRGR